MMTDSTQAVQEKIAKMVTDTEVVLFMKGNTMAPQCGFSAAVVQVLEHMGVDFLDVNVLADSDIRQGIKDFTNWPTIPQLYVKGEFVGGCDIVREMAKTGELKQLLTDKGIAITS